MIRIAKVVVLALPALLLSACQSPSTSSTTSSTTGLNVTTTTTPAIATAQPSTGVTFNIPQSNGPDRILSYTWQTAFVVSLKNSDTVGDDITAVSLKVQQAISGIVVPPTGVDIEHYQFTFTTQTGSKRLEANSSNALNCNVLYWLPNGGAEALITMTIALTNDNSISDVKTLTEQVLPPG
jgi:hypothetical protein